MVARETAFYISVSQMLANAFLWNTKRIFDMEPLGIFKIVLTRVLTSMNLSYVKFKRLSRKTDSTFDTSAILLSANLDPYAHN